MIDNDGVDELPCATVGIGDHNDTGHLRLLPPSSNWYSSQVCDWGYDRVTQRILFAFAAKCDVYVYEFDTSTTPDQQPTDLEMKLRQRPSTQFVAQLSRPRTKKQKKSIRVMAIRFLDDVTSCLVPSTSPLCLAAANEDGALVIWNIATKTIIQILESGGGVELTAIAFQAQWYGQCIVTGDQQGKIHVWQLQASQNNSIKSVVRTFVPIKHDAVFSMDMNPAGHPLVAVGYRSGKILVLDLVSQAIRYRLEGHDQEVQCMIWKPLHSDDEGSNISVLASAARDRSIKVWQLDTTADSTTTSLVRVMTIPKPKQAASYAQSNRLWLPIAWGRSRTNSDLYRLWSGSYDGSMLLWEWDRSSQAPVKPTAVRNAHNRLIFCIVPILLGDDSLLLTTSLDRELCIWHESVKATSTPPLLALERILGLGGHSYSISFHSIRNRLAIGVGDHTIRLWSISSISSNPNTTPLSLSAYRTEFLWKGLQSKVTCVQWHPLYENQLAYGTEDGQVGLWNVLDKDHTRLSISHTGEIKSLQWTILRLNPINDTETKKSSFVKAMEALESAQRDGQSLEMALQQQEQLQHEKQKRDDTAVMLWSIDTNGKLIQTHVRERQPPVNIVIRETECRSFAIACVEETPKLVALGMINGMVNLYEIGNSGLLSEDVFVRLHDHNVEVTTVAWTSYEGEGDELNFLLASSAMDGHIVVNSIQTQPQANERRILHTTGPRMERRVHSGPITCMKWSPTKDLDGSSFKNLARLASASADGSVVVWHVILNSTLNWAPIAKFLLHTGRVLCVEWMSAHILVSGGEDQSLRVWDYRHHSFTTKTSTESPPPCAVSASPTMEQDEIDAETCVAVTQTTVGNEGHTSTSSLSAPPKKAKKTKVKASFFHNIPNSKEATNSEELLASLKRVSLHESVKNTMESFDSVMGRVGNEQLLHPDRRHVLEYVTFEQQQFQQEHDWERVAQLLLFQGRVVEALSLVASEGALTAMWVSYAPMAGIEIWRDIAQQFASQLERRGDYHQASTQYLALGLVRQAIQSLCRGKAYRDAFILARTRLGVRDSQVVDVLHEYVDHLLANRAQSIVAVEDAARGLIAIGTPTSRLDAVRALGAGEENADHLEVALTLWEELSAEPAGDNVISMPSTFFLSIMRASIRRHRYHVAARAAGAQDSIQVVQAGSYISTQPLYQLTACLLMIADRLVNSKRDSSCIQPYEQIDSVLSVDDTDHVVYINRLFTCLMQPGSFSWSNLPFQSEDFTLLYRSKKFWREVFGLCQDYGMWFQSSQSLQDAQDLLMKSSTFDFLQSQGTSDEMSTLHIETSRCVLQFVVELMQGYFIGALESVRDLLVLTVTSHQNEWKLDIITLLCPCGLVDVHTPPLFEELLDETETTRDLWKQIGFYTCLAIVDVYEKVPVSNDLIQYVEILHKMNGEDLPIQALYDRLVDEKDTKV